MASPDPAARFWSKVDRGAPDACWLWQGARRSQGHGLFSVGGRLVGAHRFAYELAHGPIPPGAVVMHECDTPRCCNPAHLRAGSQSENIRDAVRRGRWPSRAGERNPSYRYTADDLAGYLARYDAGGITQAQLAAEVGVSERHLAGLLARARRLPPQEPPNQGKVLRL